MDTPASTRHPLETIEEEITSTAEDQAQENNVEEFKTKEGVFMACSKQLSERFRLAFTANCHQGQLFDDIVFLGDTESA